jgi:tight adherence protein B
MPPSLPHRPVRRARRLTLLAALLAPVALLGMAVAAPAYAATSSIDHVEAGAGRMQAVVSLVDLPEGAAPDLGTATVTFDGEPVPATAEPLSENDEALRRTAVLTLDVSRSMAGEKFEAAKAAAHAFLDNVPANMHVGLVTFASSVDVVQEPTQDRAALRDVIDSLELSRLTLLHDAVLEAVATSGDDGARSILLLSDGVDTSETPVEEVAAAVGDAGVKVDVVALGDAADAGGSLSQIARAGGGELLEADDPARLSAVFAQEAQNLAQQVLVTFEPPDALAGQEGTLEVSLQVAGEQVSDGAFVVLPAAEALPAAPELGTDLPPAEPGLVIATEWMYAGLAVGTVALLAIGYFALGGAPEHRQDEVAARIEAYTRKGAQKIAEANRTEAAGTVTQQAVAVAENVLENQEGLAEALGNKLEAAGMALKPAEWLLAHVGIAVGAGLMALLLGGGDLLFMLLGLVLGGALPWLFLSLKRRRRLAAFKAQLADTLQLMAGSLSAGLSLAQSVDTVVREGADPMAAEFRRALVETRLGVELEAALTGVAERMESVDFEWVVMAIRIQREVGGNLSELLNKVADTIREREYLERQVKTLSAEGRLSVWILAGLPPGFMAYLMMVNPSYVQPMFSSPLGLVMVTVMTILLVAGTLWMKKVVKVEV